jgi:hypothetical protein
MNYILAAIMALTGVLIAATVIITPWPKVGECSVTTVFNPEPDITAYELALILKNVSGPLSLPICVGVHKPIPNNLARHFAL